MTVWISKYALTKKGIYPLQGNGNPEIYRWFRDKKTGEVFGRGQWHRTREDAERRAMQMHYKKISEFEQQLQRYWERLRRRDWFL